MINDILLETYLINEIYPGITEPYEETYLPELIINTCDLTLNQSVIKLIEFIKLLK